MNKLKFPMLILMACSVTVTMPALAALSDCPSQSLCLWSGDNFTGAMQVVPAPAGTKIECAQSTLPEVRSEAVTDSGSGSHVLASVQKSCSPLAVRNYMRSPVNFFFPIKGYGNLGVLNYYSVYQSVGTQAK
jgi:hypothetical protein